MLNTLRQPLLLIALLSPALLGAGSWLYLNRPFEPLLATPRDLCGWLLRNDAAAAPPRLQAELFERCRTELLEPNSALDWSELDEALRTVDPKQRAIWEGNVRWWCRGWWLNEGRAYSRIPMERQREYLNKKLAHWSTYEWLALGKLRSAGTAATSTGTPATAASPAMLTEWSAEIESWIASAAYNEQPGLQEFWAALRWQLLTQPKLWKNFGR